MSNQPSPAPMRDITPADLLNLVIEHDRKYREIQRWRDIPDLDLSNTRCAGPLNFQTMTLANVNMQGAVWKGANFMRARLVGCDLTDVSLLNADLSKACLIRCALTGLKIPGAQATGLTVDDCDISRLNADGANLEGATFTCVKGNNPSFAKANLFMTNFYGGAVLVEPNFSDARASHVNFRSANVTLGNFRGAKFDSLKSREGRFLSCDFTRGSLSLASFQYADLSGSDFTDCDLQEVDFDVTNLKDVTSIGAKCAGMRLDGAQNIPDDLRAAKSAPTQEIPF